MNRPTAADFYLDAPADFGPLVRPRIPRSIQVDGSAATTVGGEQAGTIAMQATEIKNTRSTPDTGPLVRPGISSTFERTATGLNKANNQTFGTVIQLVGKRKKEEAPEPKSESEADYLTESDFDERRPGHKKRKIVKKKKDKKASHFTGKKRYAADEISWAHSARLTGDQGKTIYSFAVEGSRPGPHTLANVAHRWPIERHLRTGGIKGFEGLQRNFRRQPDVSGVEGILSHEDHNPKNVTGKHQEKLNGYLKYYENAHSELKKSFDKIHKSKDKLKPAEWEDALKDLGERSQALADLHPYATYGWKTAMAGGSGVKPSSSAGGDERIYLKAKNDPTTGTEVTRPSVHESLVVDTGAGGFTKRYKEYIHEHLRSLFRSTAAAKRYLEVHHPRAQSLGYDADTEAATDNKKTKGPAGQNTSTKRKNTGSSGSESDSEPDVETVDRKPRKKQKVTPPLAKKKLAKKPAKVLAAEKIAKRRPALARPAKRK